MPVAPAQRKRPYLTVTVSPEAIGAVAALAELSGISKSAVVEQLIRKEARREKLDLDELGRQETRRRRRRQARG